MGEDGKDDGGESVKRPKYFTPQEVSVHNAAEDCWVSVFSNVLDLSALIAEHRGPLAEPLIRAAGSDISHWFDPNTGDVKTYIDPVRGIRVAFTGDAGGRFVHVPPPEPTTSWRTDFGTPWWRDEQYVIGKLTRRTRKIRLKNALSHQEDVVTVCSEETLGEIRARYMPYNKHGESYTWKHLVGGRWVVVDMNQTLEENGIPDETDEFERLGIDEDYYYPVLHLYYDDDLTIA